MGLSQVVECYKNLFILTSFQSHVRCPPGLPGEAVLPHVEEEAGTGAEVSPDRLHVGVLPVAVLVTPHAATLQVVQGDRIHVGCCLSQSYRFDTLQHDKLFKATGSLLISRGG